MKIAPSQSTTQLEPKARLTVGQELKRLEGELKSLEVRDKEIKNRAQDRMKFMSGRNVFRMNCQLKIIEKEQEAIRIHLNALQEIGLKG